MADYLASIFGTEKDKVNCSFYFKIGACRHGDRCSRIHNRPTFSQTILLQNLYQNPQNVITTTEGSETQVTRVKSMTEEEAQEHFDDFFEDVFIELEDKYGEIEEMNVCDNLGDHLLGNVYVKFVNEEDAEKAVADLNNRWFGGKPVFAELSPVTDFREACCRQYEMGECTRSGFCNFMHLKPISRDLRRELYGRRRAAALEHRIASYLSEGGRTKPHRSFHNDDGYRPRDSDRRRDRDRGYDRSRGGYRSRRSASKERHSSSRSRHERNGGRRHRDEYPDESYHNDHRSGNNAEGEHNGSAQRSFQSEYYDNGNSQVDNSATSNEQANGFSGQY